MSPPTSSPTTRKSLSLRNKIVVLLLAVVVAYAAFDQVMQRSFVTSSFATLEQAESNEDLQRALAAVDVEKSELGKQCRRWAVWDDTWSFVKHPTTSYIESNLGEGALSDREIDLLYFCDAKGDVVWGRIEDPGRRNEIELRDFPSQSLRRNQLLMYAGEGELATGLMTTERGPMLVAAHPVFDSRGDGEDRDGDGTDEHRGHVVIGRFFDTGVAQALGEEFRVGFDLWTVTDPNLPERERELVDEITGAAEPVIDIVNDERLHIYATVPDVRGAPSLLLRARIDRTVAAEGARAVEFALLSSLGTAFLILFVLLQLLQRIVIRPLGKLTEAAVEIGRTDDASLRVALDRGDEIGQLSNEFDSMLVKLDASRAELVKTARLVGMSEIATGVLHNVGNVLNSVNVSANLVTKRTELLATSDLGMAVDILQQHKDDLGAFVTSDPQGQNLVPFLGELAGSLEEQKGELQTELRALGKGIEHIMELVRSQQSYAGQGGVFEPTNLAELLDSALNICRQAYGVGDDMVVTRDYEDLPKIPCDRHKTMEIIVNLIQNARQAMEEEGAKELALALRSNDEGRVVLTVTDSGVGISPDHLAKIFAHGFTTKKEGHGFGLHVSANAATEMKGRLYAESDGPGTGATFILELPANSQRTAAAAA